MIDAQEEDCMHWQVFYMRNKTLPASTRMGDQWIQQTLMLRDGL